jgi:hypothetical protein
LRHHFPSEFEDEFELLLLEELLEEFEDEFELLLLEELLEELEDEFELLLLDELPATCNNSCCAVTSGNGFCTSAFGKAAWATPALAIAAPARVEIFSMYFDISISVSSIARMQRS